MFEFLPAWFKALCGTGLILFIFFVGFKGTTNKGKQSKSSKSDSQN